MELNEDLATMIEIPKDQDNQLTAALNVLNGEEANTQEDSTEAGDEAA